MLSQLAPSVVPRRLLVIEPDSFWRETIVAVAAWHFPEVATVEDFTAAKRALSRRCCCAVITEYRLPGGSGLSLYDQTRRHTPDLLFVLMSADLRVALSDPQFRYLRKPFDRDELSTLFRLLTRGLDTIALARGSVS